MLMKVLIIEDEQFAAQHLNRLLNQYDPEIEVLAKIDSVKKAVKWFSDNPAPELIFMDIQLADGLSFAIFEQCLVESPIIFTTAFNEYAIKAFKVNSIDYLLKPLDIEELSAAIDKFKRLVQAAVPAKPAIDAAMIDKVYHLLGKQYKSRFLVKVGLHIRTISTDEVCYFESLEKSTFLHTYDNKTFAIDHSLDQVEELIDPEKFFRVSRKHLVHILSIKDIISYSSNRLKLVVKAGNNDEIIVSREKVPAFKSWLDN
jgi:two-component system, LytTR family, response regulator